MEKPLSYKAILELAPDDFLECMNHFRTQVDCNIPNLDALSRASARLGELSNLERQLYDLQAMAVVMKRVLLRESESDRLDVSKRFLYEDMIDKEKIVQLYAKGLTDQTRALSKSITAYIEGNKELMMTNGIVRKPRT